MPCDVMRPAFLHRGVHVANQDEMSKMPFFRFLPLLTSGWRYCGNFQALNEFAGDPTANSKAFKDALRGGGKHSLGSCY